MSESDAKDTRHQPVPLLRDPPPPPGYQDPLEGAGILDQPFCDPLEDPDDH